MKLINLSEKLLRYMVSEYKKHGKQYFQLETFKMLYPEETDDFISKALYLLAHDGLVSVLSADDVASETALNPLGIANVEENTMIKKGYTAIKEIKSLLI